MPILSEEDLERFRTKVCTLASSMRCDFGVERCNYSHNLYWARRCPFYLRDSSILRYIPACCPDVELGVGSAVLRNTCPRGNNCLFAHSLEEMNYHPLVYKTELCKEYRLGRCRTYYCHMVHGLAEFRVPRDFVLPRKRGLHIPMYAHVTIVDNIRNIQGGSSSCGHLKEKNRSRMDDSPNLDVEHSLMSHSINSSKTEVQQGHCVTQKSCPELIEPLSLSLSMFPEKENTTDKAECIRWSCDMVEGMNNPAPLLFNGFRFDDTSSSTGSQPRYVNNKKSDDFPLSLRLSDHIAELSASDAEGSTPWYGKNAEVSTIPNYNFSSFDTIFQESLKNYNRPSSDTGSGDSLSKVNSMLASDEVLARSAKVVRNVGKWKQVPPLPRSLSLQRSSDDEGPVEPAVCKDADANLLDYIYHTVSQHCEMITEKCVNTSDNRANLSLICKEAHNLWQLIVSIQSLLYDSVPGCTLEESSKSDIEALEGHWNNFGSFYSELLEAYESESGKTTGSSTAGGGLPLSFSSGGDVMGGIN